jgi:hypothetical protein
MRQISRQPYLKCIVVSISFFFISSLFFNQQAIAQTVGEYRIDVRVVSLGNNYWDDASKGARYRFYGNTRSGQWENLHPGNGCINGNKQTTIYPNLTLKPIYLGANAAREFTIQFTTHHERKDGSDGCSAQGVSGITFNKPDLYETQNNIFTTITTIADLTPGVFTRRQKFHNYNGGTDAWCELEIRYTLLTPDKPVLKYVDSLGANICANQLLTLKTNSPNFKKDGIKYKWEYSVSTDNVMVPNPNYCGPADPTYGCGHWEYYDYYDEYNGWQQNSYWVTDYCCDEPATIPNRTWHTLTNTLPYNSPTADSIVFNPLSDIFGNYLDRTKSVYFRVKAYNELESKWSDAGSIGVSPPAPSLGEVPFSTPSCPGSSTGTISLQGISGVGSYLYILNAGFDNVSANCDPTVQNCVSFNIASGSFTGNTLTIPNIPAGKYTLRITNPGDIYGTCFAWQNVQVDSFPLLKLQINNYSKTVTCFGAQDGSINLSSIGGNRTSIVYVAKNETTGETHSNSSGSFTNLKAGNYSVRVVDACNELREDILVIGEPTKIQITTVITQPTCISPVNGKISLLARAGSGSYNYLLTRSGSIVDSLNNSSDTVWNVAGLAPGNYQLSVRDGERQNCAGYDTSFTIANATQLALSLINNDPSKCYGADNGFIKLAATGGSGTYQYYLANTSTGLKILSETGEFSNVAAGTYTAYVKNKVSECLDSVAYQNIITVSQPNSIVMQFSIQHVVCKGQNNGSVTATSVTGGSGSYTYQWQKLSGTSWYDYALNGQGNGASLTNLYPGTFRLKITDTQGCVKYSEDLTVTEPVYELVLTNVEVTDIKCIGTEAKIIPTAAGGYGSYSYFYTPSGGSLTQYNPQTFSFPLGTYTIKVRDSLGCEINHPAPVTITNPTTALDFTYSTSIYNGYSISCYGNTNGKITITASGGNGGNYNGYQYAIGNINGPYRSSNVFDSLTAGDKTVYVKDERGCIVSKAITLTQPASTITATTTYTGTTCSYDSTGSITITPSGGVAPYQYKLVRAGTTNAWWENWQSSNVFNNLLWGQYTVTVKDANGCTSVTTCSLTYKTTGPALIITKQDVNCFNANTGSISIGVSSGINNVTPYSYSWTGVSATTASVNSLLAGSYTIRVTDSLGCKTDSMVVIKQPSKILTTASTRPICIGSSDGRIILNTSGGISPYMYSVNNGTSFQSSNEFNGLTAGTYHVVVKDNNNCIDTLTSQIIPINLGTTYTNFLVSSKQNAYDTVVVKEVCNPKPDSVKWVFDPAAIVVDYNQYSPRLKFNSPGTYKIKMIPYFGACDLPIEKDVVIKPFDSTIVFYNSTYAGIDTVLVLPNPNNGQFSLQVKLFRYQKLEVYIRNVSGMLIYYRRWNSVKEIMETINLNANGFLPAGSYFLKVLTDNDARDRQIIKQ